MQCQGGGVGSWWSLLRVGDVSDLRVEGRQRLVGVDGDGGVVDAGPEGDGASGSRSIGNHRQRGLGAEGRDRAPADSR